MDSIKKEIMERKKRSNSGKCEAAKIALKRLHDQKRRARARTRNNREGGSQTEARILF